MREMPQRRRVGRPGGRVGRRGRRVVGVLAVAAGLVVLAAGCSIGTSLTIPDPSQVRSLEVQDLQVVAGSSGPAPGRVVTDPGRIGAFLRALSSLNERMYTPADTFPTSQYTVVVDDASEPGLVVFVGRNWVGGRDPGRDHVLRKVSPEQRRELLQTLGVTG